MGQRWAHLSLPCHFLHHSGYTVHLGKHALGRVENGEQAMEVVRSIPHPEYQVSPTHLNHDHDIMLLELKSPVQLSSHIRTLPLSPDDCLPTGTCCRVSGWGTTTSPQGKCLHWLLETSPHKRLRKMRLR